MVKKKWWRLAAAMWMVSIFIVIQLPYFTGQNTAKVIQKAVETEPNTIKISKISVPVTPRYLSKIDRLIGVFKLLYYDGSFPL